MMLLQHVVQHEGQAGQKHAMFKITNQANLAHHFTLSVSNQISIAQEGILALISSAYWLAHEMMVANRNPDPHSSLMGCDQRTTSRCG
jgi:hypothetical protein